jgi:hypothetical protein
MARSQRRPVEDFAAIVRALSEHAKDPIVLVGGHAVNVWALTYQDRIGELLRPHQPFTSSDMDVYGTRNALLALHHDLGGQLLLSGPREITDGTLILGVKPDTREIDVLRSVKGIPTIEAQDTISLKVCGHDVPVLFPHILLQGKLDNALHLDQAERQDVKHVKVLALVLHEFLKEVIKTATPPREKPALALLQNILAVLTSTNAQEFTQRHGLAFDEIMPVHELANSPLSRLRRFGAEQLPRAFARAAREHPEALPEPRAPKASRSH